MAGPEQPDAADDVDLRGADPWRSLGRVQCFACSAAHPLASGERVGFRDCCEACGADLHVCRNCAHHDPSAYNECRESSAERVGDRERANRCDYFAPGEGGPAGGTDRAGGARDALEALFKKP